MKKTVGILVIAALFMGSNTAFASTSSIDELIAQLQQQIVLLSAKLEALKSAQGEAQSAGQNINSTLAQIGSLREGMTGEQVLLLQATLANDSSVYPEGLVTGYYGKLTRAAIERFQKRHNLDGNGTLNAKTLKELNKMLRNSSFAEEDDEDDEDGKHQNGKKRFCDASASWKTNNRDNGKHKGWDKIVLPRCKHIPQTSPKTNDTIAPTVSAISVTGINSVGATIGWTTNELAASKLYVSSTSPVTTSIAKWVDGSLQMTHTAVLTGLTASTNYYYVLEATDASSNTTKSAEGSFMTSATPDTMAPVITAFSVVPTGSSTASAIWTTDEVSSSRVYYSTTSPLNIATASSFFDAAFVTTHAVSLTGLDASTTYYTVVESIDTALNIGTSSESSFATQL